MVPKRGFIQGEPTNLISEGGNFLVRRRFRPTHTSPEVRTLRGKATPGGDIDIVKGRRFTFVRFEADPVTGLVPRSELAPRLMMPFGRTVTVSIGFRVRARQIDQLTGYVLQFWQPIISPIAGVRLNEGRIEVVSRSGGGVASGPLERGWNSLTVSLRPGPNGRMTVDGDLNGSIRGRIDGGSQDGLAEAPVFRPKFGWYGPLSQQVQVDYRRFEMSTSVP
jgi:hypothetical protein